MGSHSGTKTSYHFRQLEHQRTTGCTVFAAVLGFLLSGAASSPRAVRGLRPAGSSPESAQNIQLIYRGARRAELQRVVNGDHDVVGFDPRGVNNTTPATTFFLKGGSREGWLLREGGGGGVAGEGWRGRSLALGMACAGNAGDEVGFVGPWNVVRDLISIVDAHFPGKKRGGAVLRL